MVKIDKNRGVGVPPYLFLYNTSHQILHTQKGVFSDDFLIIFMNPKGDENPSFLSFESPRNSRIMAIFVKIAISGILVTFREKT